jgi:flagellar basal-body rod protein FlgB
MSILPISDVTTRALQASLRGLDARNAAIADNVANVETPNYKAKIVDFESVLKSAIESGSPESASPSVAESAAPTRLNGNNVSLDTEVVLQTETLLRTQLVVAALNNRYSMLRTAISGQ